MRCCYPLVALVCATLTATMHVKPCAAEPVDRAPEPASETPAQPTVEPAPLPATAASEPTTKAAPSGHVVRIHFTSDDENAMLQERSGRIWKSLCREECEIAVAPSTELRIGGNGLDESSSFTAPAAGSARVDANTAPGDRYLWGWGFFGAGVVLVGTGAIMIGISDGDSSGSLQATGAVELALGGAGVIAGLMLLATSMTDVSVRSGTARHPSQSVRLIPGGIAF